MLLIGLLIFGLAILACGFVAVAYLIRAFSDRAYDKALVHVPPGFNFTEYIAAVLPPGNIYKSMDREHVLPALLWTPLGGIALGALLGALLHGVMFGKRVKEA